MRTMVLLFGLAWSSAGYAESRLQVDVVVGPSSQVQEAVLDAFSQLIGDDPQRSVEIRQLSIEAFQQATNTEADLLVAVGTRAAEALASAETSVPRLYGFIARSAWQQIKSCCVEPGGSNTAVFLDRMPIDYLRLARLVSPSAERVGVLLGPASRSSEMEFRRAAGQLGIKLSIDWVDAKDDVGPALRQLLEDVDALITLPDPVVLNAQTIYPLLLASYSARLPVIAYSDAMVRAGAAGAVLVKPRDAGRDLAAEILHFVKTRRLRPAKSSPSLSVTLNRDVLRSLGIEPQDANLLREQLRGETR